MNRHLKTSQILASVMAMTLMVSCSIALADERRHDNPGYQGRLGWNGHHKGNHSNYASYHAYYNRGHHQGYYPHYYRPQLSCGTYSQENQHHHNNSDHHWWNFW